MGLFKSEILSVATLGAYLTLGYLTLSEADNEGNSETAVGADQSATDGELFVKRLVHGEKITQRPEYLLFTAPYRLCANGCKNNDNFVFSFPMYVGKKGMNVYQSMYHRDSAGLQSINPYAPFKSAVILMMLSTLEASEDILWHKWSWAQPLSPIEHFFRRHGEMPVKSPDTNFVCQCPPNKECELDFKMNEDMIEFLSLRGLIKPEQLASYQKDVEDYRRTNGMSPREQIRIERIRRNNLDGEECCCPPHSLMVPTFISDKKFNEVRERFDKKQLSPTINIKMQI